jgi:hypothetical protein
MVSARGIVSYMVDATQYVTIAGLTARISQPRGIPPGPFTILLLTQYSSSIASALLLFLKLTKTREALARPQEWLQWISSLNP